MAPITPLHGQGELLAHLPYQLGFVPSDSVVVVGFDQHNTIVVTLRIDPPAHTETEAMVGMFSRGRLSRLCRAAVVVTDNAPALLAGALVLRQALTRNGIEADHVLHVDYPHRVWSALVCQHGCCPTHSLQLPPAHEIRAVLEAAVRGVDPAASREEVEARCLPTDQEVRIAMRVGLCRGTVDPDPAAIMPIVDLTRPVPTDPRCLSQAAAAIGRSAVRDALLHWLRPRDFPPSTIDPADLLGSARPAPPPHLRPTVVARMVRWACRVPDQDAVPIWTCVAAMEWAGGGGPLATIALDTALRTDPDYRLANLVHQCLMLGILPSDQVPPSPRPRQSAR